MTAIIHAMRGAGGLLSVACCAVVAALCFGAAAAAAPAYGPPAGWPDLAPMALGTADFPGSHISSQGYVKPDTDSLAEYEFGFPHRRQFSPAVQALHAWLRQRCEALSAAMPGLPA